MSEASNKHKWTFASRFRRAAFGWRSDPAIARIKEALTEIKAVNRKEPLLAAEGAALFLTKLAPSLEKVDSSSGAIGTAVNRAIDVLAQIIANAPADRATRRKWLESLYQAHADDRVPYIERLADYWGDLCASADLAGEWADRLTPFVEAAWGGGADKYGFFHATPMCLSALLASEQHTRLLALLEKCNHQFWPYHQWGVKALVAMGKKAEALRYAEAMLATHSAPGQIAEACEAILLSSGLADEAYRRYALDANQAGTYLATFRALCRKYPHKRPEDVLHDLVASTPGKEGKWFAAAKDAKLYDLALQLAQKSPVDHRTLIRSAQDFTSTEPNFALNSALLALYWICAGSAYEATISEVQRAYDLALQAAETAQGTASALERIQQILDSFPQERFVRTVLSNASGLPGEFR